MWTENFLLDLEQAEEPEIKLPTSIGSYKKQENSRKSSIFVSLTTLKPLTLWITTNCGNFLEYQTNLSVTWEMCMQVKKQQLEPDMEQWTGKGVCQGCIMSLCLFNLYVEYIMWNARLDEAQAGIKISRRNINNLRYADDTPLMVGSGEELNSLLIRMKIAEWLKT